MTAAISAASTPFSAACWRMMSSWLRGSVSSSIALLSDAGRDRDPDQGRHSERPRRRGQQTPPASLPSSHPPSFSTRADSARSRSSTEPSFSITCSARPGLLLLGELARLALVDQGVAACRGALAANVVGGDDRDGGVEDAVHAGLEQQRHLDHGDLGAGRAARPARRRSARRPAGGSATPARSAARGRRRRSRRSGRGRRRPPARPRLPSARPGGRAAARSRAARGRPRRWRASPRPVARRPPAPPTCRPRCRR